MYVFLFLFFQFWTTYSLLISILTFNSLYLILNYYSNVYPNFNFNDILSIYYLRLFEIFDEWLKHFIVLFYGALGRKYLPMEHFFFSYISQTDIPVVCRLIKYSYILI